MLIKCVALFLCILLEVQLIVNPYCHHFVSYVSHVMSVLGATVMFLVEKLLFRRLPVCVGRNEAREGEAHDERCAAL